MTDSVLVEDFWENEAGGRHWRAVTLSEVKATCENAYESFRHEDDFPADVLEAMRLIGSYEFRV